MTEGQLQPYCGAITRCIRSLPGRLLLTLLAIHLVLAPLLVIFVLQAAEQNYKDRFIDQARSDAQWVQTLLQAMPRDTNVQVLMDDLVLNPFRQSVQLFDARNIRLAGAGTFPELSMNDLPEDFEFGQHEDALYWIASPLQKTASGEKYTLRLAYDETPIANDIDKLYFRSIQLAASYLVLVIAAVAVFGSYLSHALRQIGTAAHRIATGHIHDRFHPTSSATEIIDLSADLEHMRKELVTRGQLLEEQGQHLHTLLDHIAEGVVTFDLNGLVETANPAAQAMFAYTTRLLEGLNITDWLPGLRIPPEADSSQPARQHVGQRLDGTFVTVELTISRMKHGGANMYLALIRDISERKRVEDERKKNREELTHARRLSSLGEMAANLAHELNQPLAAINLYIQGGLRRLGDQPDRYTDIRTALEKASRQAQRAGGIISQIRSFVKKTPTRPEPTDINRLIRDVTHLVETETAATSTDIQLKLCDNQLTPVLDRLQIQQVLINLISNGIEAMNDVAPSDRVLIISTACDTHSVELTIEDRGCGVSEAIADTLFDPFISGRDKGIGLGLAISRSIIEEHGGRLWYTGSPNGGSCFSFTLPLTIEDSSHA
ncbi:MAG: PAS domain S-box protein [Thermotogales bacterium]|nr:PAS domain S-box protein [Thermotogales bacterium]